ncbi:MAG: FAD-dependent oxidoreductase [Proteobacteria bacterium]|nr:FAD-dependent oxidoreductase [Pseudomonadota bacterium]HQR02904.1 FAD-dependent oxidoreductase [Rhodocyclaceae bacterium]
MSEQEKLPQSSTPDGAAGSPGDRRRFLKTAVGSAIAAGTGIAGGALAATAPLQHSEVRHWDGETDLLIMGSGIGGIAAAIEARRQGMSALVLEKFNVLGGSSALSGGVCYMGGGTPLQKALGFEDSTQAMHDFMVAASGVYAPKEKIAVYCDGSLDHFDWLVENGVKYAQRFSAEKELSHKAASLYYCGCEKSYPFRNIAHPAPRGHVPPAENQTGGRELMTFLIAAARRLGADIRTEVDVERLVMESDGSVAGLRVMENGRTLHIRARKGVVLAAGGFVHNSEMMASYAPDLNRCRPRWGHAGHLGQGILMGMSVGGRTRIMDHGFSVLPLYPPEDVLKGVVVNGQGQRCITEDTYYGVMGHEILVHQKGRGYLIVDAACDYPALDYRVVIAARDDTIAGLAAKLHLPPGVLEETVAYYNKYAAQGQDPLFGKAPPFLAPLQKGPYSAYDLSPEKAFYAVQTFGGLETNVDGEVINAWGEAIPGLYAAGRTSAGIPVSPYYASGLSIGDGSFFGRRVAKHAARRKA